MDLHGNDDDVDDDYNDDNNSNNNHIPLSITNKMQRFTIFFITVNAVHVSDGFSAHHLEFNLYIQQLVYIKLPC
jgi:hypothetical protein